jgi:hypothetical protein
MFSVGHTAFYAEHGKWRDFLGRNADTEAVAGLVGFGEEEVCAPGKACLVSQSEACLKIVGLLVLVLQGCTKKPESLPLASFRVDYQTWTCRQLGEEADLLHDALAVASEHQRKGADDTVQHLTAAMEAVNKAKALKKCRG